MKLSVGLPSFSSKTHAIPPDRFRRYARLAEAHQFAGAWLIEHLIVPPTYATSLLDPLTTLALVAGETETLPLGTSVLLLPLRDPVMVAKRAVSIQHLASRRLTLGLGTGYVQAEFDAVGVPMAERSPRFLEGIELIRRLFTEAEVTYEGEYYSVEGFTLEPELGQPPRILAGGGGVDTDDGRRVLQSVQERLDHADGWIAPPRALDTLESDWTDFAAHLESQNRDPSTVDKAALQYIHLEPTDDSDRARRVQQNVYRQLIGAGRSVDHASQNWLSGTVDEIRDTLEGYERQNFDEVILHPVSRNPDELDRQLSLWDEYLHGQFH